VPGVDPLKYQEAPELSNRAAGDEWLTVKLRYKDPESDASKLLSKPLTGRVVPFADAPSDFRFAASVAEFGLLLRHSDYRGTATYGQVRHTAQKSLGRDPNGHRAEFLKLVDAAEALDTRK
jgi:Ca-activated chloride channel family protein